MKYSQAISQSLIGPAFSPPTGPDREDRAARSSGVDGQRAKRSTGRHRKKADGGTKAVSGAGGSGGASSGESDPETSTTRAESFAYFLSLLRSYSAENGKFFLREN